MSIARTRTVAAAKSKNAPTKRRATLAKAATHAPKKLAKKVGFKPFPVATALLAVLNKVGKLRLVRTTPRMNKWMELELGDSGVTVREGAVGTTGRMTKQLKVRRSAGEAWVLRQAKSLLTEGYVGENFALDPGVLSTWLAEVKRIGKSRGWDIESEKVFTR